MSGWPTYPLSSANGANGSAQTPALWAPAPTPTPPAKPKKGRLRLDSAAAVRREIVKVYRAVKLGEMEVTVGSKLVYILEVLSRHMERESLERLSERLDRVEQDKTR